MVRSRKRREFQEAFSMFHEGRIAAEDCRRVDLGANQAGWDIRGIPSWERSKSRK
jgi:hypothetical protein